MSGTNCVAIYQACPTTPRWRKFRLCSSNSDCPVPGRKSLNNKWEILKVITATLLVFLSACASPPPDQKSILHKAEARIEAKQKEEELIRERSLLYQQLDLAKTMAVVSCSTKSVCDKAFSLTKIFIQQNSDMKIQLLDDTLVESFNPVDAGKVSLGALKIPGTGESAHIELKVNCKDYETADATYCLRKMRSVYIDFKPFVESALN